MTSSTASSAGSASASKRASRAPRAGSPPGWFLGLDEAGYGPNLGPLLIAATRWRTPRSPHQCDLYKLLSAAVRQDRSGPDELLHVADSKQVHTGPRAFACLELSALALLRCGGFQGATLRELCDHLLCPQLCQSHPFPAWYACDMALPLVVDEADVGRHSDRLRRVLNKSGVELTGVAADLVTEARFNRAAAEFDSKGLALSRFTLRLLRRLWGPEIAEPCCIVGDKHGGRNRYDELLAEVLDGELVFRIEEHSQCSRYRIGVTEVRFQVRGEEHLPVAAASLVAKYLREVCMRLFNAYWRERLPEVKPTCGYPGDAGRFYSEIEPVVVREGIDRTTLWRER